MKNVKRKSTSGVVIKIVIQRLKKSDENYIFEGDCNITIKIDDLDDEIVGYNYSLEDPEGFALYIKQLAECTHGYVFGNARFNKIVDTINELKHSGKARAVINFK